MTILSALAELYQRLEQTGKAPPQGYSMEKIGGEVVLGHAGTVRSYFRRQKFCRQAGWLSAQNRW